MKSSVQVGEDIVMWNIDCWDLWLFLIELKENFSSLGKMEGYNMRFISQDGELEFWSGVMFRTHR